MRGKRYMAIPEVITARNIPAYAGKTGSAIVAAPLWPEHPRVCGENAMFSAWPLRRSGTSPRMRGKQIPIGGANLDAGNIPAYAGKTATPAGTAPAYGEHPRVCGENHHHCPSRPSSEGTSPRMRGKRAWHWV